MSFNISQIINKFIPAKLIGSDIAYDGASDSIKAKIINAVEVLQPDAFQMEQVIFPYAARSATPTEVKITPPEGAKGFICELYVRTANANLVAGEGVRMNVKGSSNPNMDIGGLQVMPPHIRNAYYHQTLVWYPGATNGDLRNGEGGKYNYFVPVPLPKSLKFNMDIVAAANGGGGVDVGMTLCWLT